MEKTVENRIIRINKLEIDGKQLESREELKIVVKKKD